jgi:hypothetical protein
MIDCTNEALAEILKDLSNDQLRKYIALCNADTNVYATQDSFVFARIVMAKRAGV